MRADPGCQTKAAATPSANIVRDQTDQFCPRSEILDQGMIVTSLDKTGWRELEIGRGSSDPCGTPRQNRKSRSSAECLAYEANLRCILSPLVTYSAPACTGARACLSDGIAGFGLRLRCARRGAPARRHCRTPGVDATDRRSVIVGRRSALRRPHDPAAAGATALEFFVNHASNPSDDRRG
jgi:hypothetical protein